MISYGKGNGAMKKRITDFMDDLPAEEVEKSRRSTVSTGWMKQCLKKTGKQEKNTTCLHWKNAGAREPYISEKG